MDVGKLIKKGIVKALTKDDGKSVHEKLNIKIDGVQNLSCMLSKQYLVRLVEAVNNVHISKFRYGDLLKETRTYWDPLKEVIKKNTGQLADLSEEILKSNDNIVKQINGMGDTEKIIKSVQQMKGKEEDALKKIHEKAKLKAECEDLQQQSDTKEKELTGKKDTLSKRKKEAEQKFNDKYSKIKKEFESACSDNRASIQNEIEEVKKQKLAAENKNQTSTFNFSKYKTVQDLEKYINSICDIKSRMVFKNFFKACEALAMELYK